MKRNIYLIIAAINVYGINIYGRLYLNTESGKGNFEEVLGHRMKLGTINRTVSYLIKEGMLYVEKTHYCEGRLVSIGSLRDYTKSFLKMVIDDL